IERTALSPAEIEQSLEKVLCLLANLPVTKVAFFLASLPTSLDNVVDNLTTKDSLTYNDTCQRLLDLVEGDLKGDDKESAAFVTTIPKKFKKTKSKPTKAVCAYCILKGYRGLGHSEDQCRTKAKDAKEAADLTMEDYAFIISGTSNMNGWVFDTAATAHMTPRKELVKDLRTCSRIITIGNGNKVRAMHIGTMTITMTIQGKKKSITIQDV